MSKKTAATKPVQEEASPPIAKQSVEEAPVVEQEKRRRGRPKTIAIASAPVAQPQTAFDQILSVRERARRCKVNKNVKTIWDCIQCNKKVNGTRAQCVRDNEIK